jgi:hypothetical protein
MGISFFIYAQFFFQEHILGVKMGLMYICGSASRTHCRIDTVTKSNADHENKQGKTSNGDWDGGFVGD